jgi:hypothetical protein
VGIFGKQRSMKIIWVFETCVPNTQTPKLAITLAKGQKEKSMRQCRCRLVIPPN